MGAIQWGKALGRRRADKIVASATSINVGAALKVRLSGTTTVATVLSGGSEGRPLIIEGSANGNVTLTNNNDTTTEGQMDLGGSNLTLGGPEDSVILRMTEDRAWRKVVSTDL